MHNHAIEDGWQQFLDRLRRLWPKRSTDRLPSWRSKRQAVQQERQLNVWEDEGGAAVRPTLAL